MTTSGDPASPAPPARALGGAAWVALLALLLVALVALNPPLRHAARNLVPLGAALLVTVSLCGLGLPLARRLAPRGDAVLHWLTGAALGLGLTSMLVLGLGLLGAFHRASFAAWFALGLVAAAHDLARRRPWQLPTIDPSPWNLQAVAALAAFTVPFVPFVVAPVASTDELQYHLLIPQIHLAQGGISRIPLLVQAAYPSLAEHVYLPVLQLFGDVACKGLHFWVTGLVLVALGRLSRAAFPQVSPLLAPALFLAMPATIVHAGWAWNDLTFTLFVLLGLLFMAEAAELPAREGGLRCLFAAGLMIGLASWTKYTFVLVLLALLLLLAVTWIRWTWRARHVAAFVGGIWVVAPFWLVPNAVLLRNPVYPFLNGIFRSPYWSEASDRHFHFALRSFEIPDWQPWTYLTWPVHVGLMPRIIETHLGMMPLALAPLLLVRSTTRQATLLRIYAACLVVAWMAIRTETRSLFTLFAVILVVGCGIVQRPGFLGRIPAAVARVLIAAGLACSFWLCLVTTQHLMSPVDVFLGRESRASYLERVAESQRAYAWLNTRDDVGGVLLVALHGPYYLEKPYLFSGFTDTPAAEALLKEARTAEEMRRRLQSLGVTHVVVAPERLARQVERGLWSWPREQHAAFHDLLAGGCDVVASFDGDVVLRLR